MDEATDMAKTLKEAAYVGIGFGVLGFQRAQVRRRQLAELGRDLERRLQPALVEATDRMEPLLAQIEARLSEQAKDVAQALSERYRRFPTGGSPQA